MVFRNVNNATYQKSIRLKFYYNQIIIAPPLLFPINTGIFKFFIYPHTTNYFYRFLTKTVIGISRK